MLKIISTWDDIYEYELGPLGPIIRCLEFDKFTRELLKFEEQIYSDWDFANTKSMSI